MKRARGVIAWFMALAMLVTPFASAQDATPVSGDDPTSLPPAVGSIKTTGLDGGEPPTYSVIAYDGTEIASGVLDSPLVESQNLATAPGAEATLTVWSNDSYEATSANAVAEGDGALHFIVNLVAIEVPAIAGATDTETLEAPENMTLDQPETLARGSSFETFDDDSTVTVTINVTGDDGSLAANVSVELRHVDQEYRVGNWTSDSGRVSFEVEPGDYSIHILPQQYYGAFDSADAHNFAADTHLNVSLPTMQYGSVSVLCNSETTTCSDHAGANVLLLRSDGRFQDEGSLSANGTITFSRVPVSGEAYTVAIAHHGQYLRQEIPVTVTTANADHPVTPSYTTGDSARVTFTFAHDDGEPVSDGWIWIEGSGYEYTYSLNWGSSGELTVDLLIGADGGDGGYEYIFEASSHSSGYKVSTGGFTVSAGDDIVIPVTLEKHPPLSFNVQDADGNPIPWVSIDLGATTEGGEFYRLWGATTDETGAGVVYVGDEITHWRVLPFGEWNGATGAVNGDSIVIKLETVTELGTLSASVNEANVPWFEVDLNRADGWRGSMFVDSSWADVETATLTLPAGEYSWVANAGYGYHTLSGEVTIDNGGIHYLGELIFEQQPAVDISVVDQHNNPVSDIVVTFMGIDEPWARSDIQTNESGDGTVGLPIGDYWYAVDAPAKYALQADAIHQHRSQDGSSLAIELDLLPNGTLTINVDTPDEYPVDGWLTVRDSAGNDLATQYVESGGQYEFAEFPFGSGYTVYMHDTRWYAETMSEPFEFTADNEDEVIHFPMSPYEVVDVIVTASSTTDSPIRTMPTLMFMATDTWWDFPVWLDLADDGSATTTVTVPRGEYELYAPYGLEGNATDDLPTVVNLADADSPYSIDIALTPPPYGLAIFTISSPNEVAVSGSIDIEQDGIFVNSAWVEQGSTSATSYDALDAGTYAWSFDPGGVLQPVSGSFTIVDGDVTVPIDLRVGQNGIVIVTTSLPDGLEELDYGGSISVFDSDGRYITGRTLQDIRVVAVGPVLYGDYAVTVSPFDQRLAASEPVAVTVDSESVNVAATLTVAPEAPEESELLRIKVESESGEPIVGGTVYVTGQPRALDEDGYVEYDVHFETAWIDVTALNFQSTSYFWDSEDGYDVVIQLTTPVNYVVLTVEDQFGNPLPNMNVWGTHGSGLDQLDGTYLIFAGDAENTSITVDARDYTGVHDPIESEEVEITDRLTEITLVMNRSEEVVTDVTISVDFGDSFPELNPEQYDEVWVGLMLDSDDEYAYVAGVADEDGNVTIPEMVAGEYIVSVYRFGERWKYNPPTPEVITVVADVSAYSVEMTLRELVPVTFVVQTSDGEELDMPTRVTINAGGFSGQLFIEDRDTVELPAGTFSVYAHGTGFYDAASVQGTIDTDGMVFYLPMQRIAAVPVPAEPITPTPTTEPTVTPTATSTPTETPSVTPSVTPPGSGTPGEGSPAQGDRRLIVRFELPGGEDLSGAPYSLYAPMAAQFLVEPYLTGVVGPNNTIEVSGLLPGSYRLLVEPVGMPPIDVVIRVGSGPVTEAMVRVDDDGVASVVDLQQETTPTPATSPDAPAETGRQQPAAESQPSTASGAADADAPGVTGLPSTGTGLSSGMSIPIAAMALALALALIAIPLGIVNGNRKQR